MKRYRKEFKELFEATKFAIDKNFNRIFSKKGQVESDEGETYQYRYVFEIKNFNKKYMLRNTKVFSVSIKFNVAERTDTPYDDKDETNT